MTPPRRTRHLPAFVVALVMVAAVCCAVGPAGAQTTTTTAKAKIPAGRFGEVDELALAALYLASDESRFVNGVELLVDGGMSLN